MPEQSMPSTKIGDGGSGPVSSEELTWFRQEIQKLQSAAGTGTWNRRQTNDNVRFCQWPGKATDGLKHREALGGQEPFPFNGASDCEVPLADMLINERVAICVAAGMRAHLQISGMELSDEATAGHVKTLLRWTIRNQLGRAYWRELVKVANYAQGDTPAVGILGVFWRREWSLKLTALSPESILQKLTEMFPNAIRPEDLAAARILMTDPKRTAEAAGFLTGLMPQMTKARAKKIVQAFQKGETTEFPEPYLKVNVPKVMALRLGVDVFLPVNTAEVKRARLVYHREMLSETDLRARIVTDKYRPSFVDALIGQGTAPGFEGRTCLPDGVHTVSPVVLGMVGSSPTVAANEDYTGLYEVITAYWRDVNDDNIPAIYTMTFSGFVDETATDRQLLDYRHGEYPYVEFPAEILSDRLMDSRSVPERTQTQQATLKQQHDMRNDVATLGTLPPICVPHNRPDIPLRLGPMAQLKEKRPGDHHWLQPPDFPQVAVRQSEETRRQVDEYWGRPNKDVDPGLVTLARQHLVDGFLTSLADALTQLLQLEQQFLPEEQIQRVTGSRTLALAQDTETIQGKYDLTLDFDVRTLDAEYVLKLAKAMMEWVLPADTNQTVQRDQYVALILGAINPVLAEATLRPVEDANAAEAKDEDNNFALIAAGVEPPMKESGQNYGLRLQRLESIPESNPAAIARLQPDSVALLENRLKHLRFMVEQEQNKQIGRVGTSPAELEPVPEAAA